MAKTPLIRAPSQFSMGEDVSSYLTWTPKNVADYFGRQGYEQYNALWVKHNLNGERVVMLTPQDLEKMGIDIIGDRLGIQKELRRLKGTARIQARNKVIAQQKEAFDGSDFDKLLRKFSCSPLELGTYTLTASTLHISENLPERCCGRKAPWLGGKWSTRSFPLTNIENVETELTEYGSFPFKTTYLTINIDYALGVDDTASQKCLTLAPEEGKVFAKRLKDQVEECKFKGLGDADAAA